MRLFMSTNTFWRCVFRKVYVISRTWWHSGDTPSTYSQQLVITQWSWTFDRSIISHIVWARLTTRPEHIIARRMMPRHVIKRESFSLFVYAGSRYIAASLNCRVNAKKSGRRNIDLKRWSFRSRKTKYWVCENVCNRCTLLAISCR